MRNIKTAVVTGATGAVGCALTACLAQNDIQVTVLSRKGSSRRKNILHHPNVRVLDADLQQLRDLTVEELGHADAFFHLAWMGTTGASRNDMPLQNQNVAYALDAVQLASQIGCQVFVGTGSQAEYGRVQGKLAADTPAFPENGYGMAKLCAGQMTRVAAQQAGMAHVWVRILSVYGPFDTPNSLVMSCVDQLLRGLPPRCTPGEQQWDYLFSGDAATALLLLAQKGHDGGVYPLGGGQTRPLKDYICAIRDAINPALPVELGAIPYPDKQVMYLCADTAPLQQDTGFVPGTPFEEGIRQTIAWAKEVL